MRVRIGLVWLGYLLTFTCYGNRLHGDTRASVDRKNNRYGMPLLSPESRRSRASASRMKHLAYRLDPPAASTDVE